MPSNIKFIFSTQPDSKEKHFGFLSKLEAMPSLKETKFFEIEEISSGDGLKTIDR